MNDLLLPAVQKGAAAQDTDPYYNLVSLHLKGDVNTGRTYNAFSDASSNNFRLTNNGDVRGSSFSPYNTSWSNYFSGSSQYLSVADSTAFTLGSGDFTVEAWVYKTSTGRQAITGQTDSVGANTSASFGLEINASNKVVGSVCSGATGYLATSTADIVLNQWNHIAFVRDGNTLRIYINGVQDGTASVTGITVNDSANQVAIGRTGEYASLYWIGYISNCRLVKGRCVYPSGTTFTPPTAPLTRTTGGTNPPQGTECSLLTCQSNRFIDNSIANTGGTPFTITANGSPTVSSFSPFLETDTTTGSGYFDGTGDYATVPSDAAFNFANADFTIEGWFYATSNSYTGAGLISKWNDSGNQRGWLLMNRGDGNVLFNYSTTGSDYPGITFSNAALTVNAWTHLALVRSGNTLTLYRNGLSMGSSSFTATIFAPSTAEAIGCWFGGSGTPEATSGFSLYLGYASNIRVVKGAAVYSGTSTTTPNFTPPTAPLARSGAASASAYPSTTNVNTSFAESATSLLTLQDRGAYNTIGFQDESEYQHVITRPSGANVAQGTFSPFSQTGWGNLFGSGNYLNTASNAAFGMGTGDFTVEAWIFATSSLTGYQAIFADGFVTNSVFFGNTAGGFGLRAGNVSDILVTTAPSINQWVHVAVTRSSSTVRLFYNGTQQTTIANSTNFVTQSAYVGNDGGGSAFPGYISNLRVVKGQALYTGNFTPATSTLNVSTVGSTGAGVPTQTITGTVSLLTCQSNRFVDNGNGNSGVGFTFTRNGSPTVVAFSPFKPVAYDPAVHGGSGYFDGTGDYLTAPNNAAYDFGTGNFTVETWVYITSYTGGATDVIISNYQNSTNGWTLGIFGTTGKLYFAIAGDSGQIDDTAALPLNQWVHLAAVRSSTTMSLFVNGTRAATTTNSTNNTSTSVLTIGTNVGGGALNFNGYLSNTRVVKGTAVYDPTQTTITVPTAPLPLLGNTSLLLNFTNGGVIDSTGKNVIETVGNAGVVTTTIKKYGSGSMFFDGTDDRMVAPSSQNLVFGTGDFTVEGWFYTGSTGNLGLFQISGTTGGLQANQTNNIAVYSNNLVLGAYYGGTVKTGTTAISASTWTHFALVRNSSVTRLYVNGVADGGFGSNSDTQNYTGQNICVGGYYGTSNLFNGYIDDLRITRGYARYTTGTGANANQMVFTGTNTLALPTKALPDRGTSSTLTTDMAAPSSVEALVVAGGGGGGAGIGSGGGAGGFRELVGASAVSVTAGTSYPLTIGAGGPGGASGGANSGSKGVSSVFSGITSEGGGFGAGVGALTNGGPGGSGGGGGWGGAGGTASTSPSGQGNAGGSSTNNSGFYTPGSGGGAGAVGSAGAATGGTNGGGGLGSQSSINGVSPSPYYAGGGGAGGMIDGSGSGTRYQFAGPGGNGGGGYGGDSSGGAPSTSGTSGTANTGGGGGGGFFTVNPSATRSAGGAGGSGVVILAYPTSFRPLKASLGLVYTIDTVTRPGYRVYRFTAGTGNISW